MDGASCLSGVGVLFSFPSLSSTHTTGYWVWVLGLTEVKEKQDFTCTQVHINFAFAMDWMDMGLWGIGKGLERKEGVLSVGLAGMGTGRIVVCLTSNYERKQC